MESISSIKVKPFDKETSFNKNIWPKMKRFEQINLLFIIQNGIVLGDNVLMGDYVYKTYTDYIKEMEDKYKEANNTV